MKIAITSLCILLLLIMTELNYGQDSTQIERRKEFNKKVESAEKYKIENKLGIVIMSYDSMDEEVGYNGFQFHHETGKYDIVIKVWLLNTGNKVISVNPLYFKVVTQKGYTLSINDYTFRTKSPFQATDLEPETKTSGLLVFGLTDPNDEVKFLIYDDLLGHRVSRDYADAKILKMQRDIIKYNLDSKK